MMLRLRRNDAAPSGRNALMSDHVPQAHIMRAARILCEAHIICPEGANIMLPKKTVPDGDGLFGQRVKDLKRLG